MEKGAYRPIHPSLIGRDDERLGFTSQSGKTAVYEIINKAGYPITMQEAVRIAPVIKEAAEKTGELPTRDILDIYYREIFDIKGTFRYIELKKLEESVYNLKFSYKDSEFDVKGYGDGPLEGCLDALSKAGFPQKLLHYEQSALGEELKGVAAEAMTIIHFADSAGEPVICRGKDPSTAKANVKAIFNGLNILESFK